MNSIRIVFMGTPEFAVPSLVALHEAAPVEGWELVGVSTQPDRPAGRGNKVIATPVKAQAQQVGLPILQPTSFRKDPAALPALTELQPDLLVVAAYGLILPRAVLALPKYGAINVHASLLPAYRGASPITSAILDGRDKTGVTIMQMDVGMDTGPALAQAEQAIRPDDTTASLSERLAIQGGSNGGLLVGAVMNQRPDLFRVAIPQVGVMDMLRFHTFTIGWNWVADYGSSANPEQFKALYAYSPLHNIKAGVRYPSTFITTADHDDRVVPAHSFKYAATLQKNASPERPALIRIETRSGHGASSTSKMIDTTADIYAFLFDQLGIPPRLAGTN